jgi:carbon-monoxide dehydrogenase medium subunit
MKPAAFTYYRARTIEDALALLAEHPDAKALAGGQSLIPAMNFRLARPSALVDLNLIGELNAIEGTADGGLRIGAMTRHANVERSELVRRRAPLVSQAMPHVAHPQIRSRGTLGGSIAHADPSAELPAVMLALGARFVLRSRGAERSVAADAFFTGLFSTALAAGELLVAVELPPRAKGSGSAFLEMARRHGDYALCGVAVELVLDGSGRVSAARLGLLSVGDAPVLARAADALTGKAPTEALAREVGELVRTELDPPADIHASASYRRQLAAVLTRRAILVAAADATSARTP